MAGYRTASGMNSPRPESCEGFEMTVAAPPGVAVPVAADVRVAAGLGAAVGVVPGSGRPNILAMSLGWWDVWK